MFGALHERVAGGSRNVQVACVGLCGYPTRNLKVAATPHRVCERFVRVLCLGLFLVGMSALQPRVQAQTLQPGQKLDPLSMEWPRFFATNGYEFAVYQPQISKWPGNQIEGRFAVAVRPAGTSNETYGVFFFKARTEIDKVNRLVTLEDFQISKVNFPTQNGMQKIYQMIIEDELPRAAKTIPLDHLEAVFVVSAEVAKAKIQPVKNDPPRVIYTTQPSLLILVDGAPILKPLVVNYERVMNTRAILLLNTNFVYQGYYLYAASNWYSAPSLEGPWTVNMLPPNDLNIALEAVFASKQVDPMYPKSPLAAPLTVYVSTTPAELLQSTGVANLLSVAGTDLLYVSNSDNAIFYYLDDANYYVLISGRWFKSLSLYGSWAFVPPGKLPGDFKKIPPVNPKSNVLASVPGTPMAQEAVIANSIPQTATIERDKAKLAVTYVGPPGFTPIQGTSLKYATNTTTPVIMVNPMSYYSCEGGVWFVSPGSIGPWAVALSVPSVIYTIPVSCPIHYVTYSYVYGSTVTYVYVGYTPGYMGTVIAPGGVVVYGTGYYYPPVVVGTIYVTYPPTYGYGWGMAVGAAAGFAFGYCAGVNSSCWCEPHWGCYGYAYPYGYSYTHVNCNSANFYTSWGTAVHATGSYGYNAYTGTSWGTQHANTFNPYTGTVGSVSRGAAVNPYTGGYAAGSHGSWYNPYSGAQASGSKGVEGNAYTGNYAAGKQGGGYNPTTGMYGAAQKGTVGNAYTGTSSSVDRGVVGNANTGNKVAWNNGNVYADKNGNAYSYNSSSGVNKYNTSAAQSAAKSSSSSWSDSGWNSSNWNKSGGASSDASRESWGQSTGSDRFSSWSHSGGGGWGGFHGGGGRR